MPPQIELTLEQSFQQKVIEQQAAAMSREEAIAMVIKLHKHLLEQKQGYLQLLKKDWGIG
jgi:hypothetical protein